MNAHNSSQLIDKHLNLLNEAKQKTKNENQFEIRSQSASKNYHKELIDVTENQNSDNITPKHQQQYHKHNYWNVVEPQHIKSIEIKKTYVDYDNNDRSKDFLKTLNENYSQTFIKHNNDDGK